MRRVRGRLGAIVAAIAVLLIVPSIAAAQNPTTNPFTPVAPVPQPAPSTGATQTVITTPTTSTSGGSLSGGSVVAIAIGAIVLLVGISLFIWYDARRRAPVRHRMATAGAGSRPGSKRPKPRKLSPAERRRRKRGRAR